MRSRSAAASATQTATIAASTTDPYYLVFLDGSGTTSYNAAVTRTDTAATAAAETEPNDTKGQANTIATLPAVVQGAKLSSATDEDWFAITVPAGKSVHVTTIAGDPLTDTVVDVLDNAGTSLGGPSADSSFHEDFTSTAAPTAGTYYVHITASPSYSSTHTAYDAIIRLE